MVRAVYYPVIALFEKFEPLANGFIDDRIRSSLLLAQGDLAGRLAEVVSTRSGVKHNIKGISNTGQIRGLNPGFAFGELVVVAGDPENISYSAKKIYILQRTPSDMI